MQKLERLQKSKKAKKNPQVVNDYIASTQQKSGPAMMFATIDYPGCATSLNRAPCHRRPARPQPNGATALAHVAAAARRRRPRRSPRAGRRYCTRPAWHRRVTSLRTTLSSSQRRCRPGRRERSAGDLGAAPRRGHTARPAWARDGAFWAYLGLYLGTGGPIRRGDPRLRPSTAGVRRSRVGTWRPCSPGRAYTWRRP